MMSGIAALIDSKLEQNARNKSLSLRPSLTPLPADLKILKRELRPGSSSTTAPPAVSQE